MLEINYDKFILELARNEMTTLELESKSRVGRNTISKIINGKTIVRPQIVGKIARALNVSVEQIVNINK